MAQAKDSVDCTERFQAGVEHGRKQQIEETGQVVQKVQGFLNVAIERNRELRKEVVIAKHLLGEALVQLSEHRAEFKWDQSQMCLLESD